MEYSMVELKEMSNEAVASKLFNMPSQAAAFSLMLVCQSEGLHPVQALRRFHIINGRPAMRADAMQAAFQQTGGKIVWKQRDDVACEAVFSHPQGSEVTIRWTMDMAKAAGLTNNANWKKFPRQMLHARCVSEGVRSSNPAIVCGFYTPEEVSDFDAKPAPEPKKMKKAEVTKVETVKPAEPVTEVTVAEPVVVEPVKEEKPAEPQKPELSENTKFLVEQVQGEVIEVKKAKPEEIANTGAEIAEKIRKARSKAMEFGCRSIADLENFTEVCLGKKVGNLTSLSVEELDKIINFKENN